MRFDSDCVHSGFMFKSPLKLKVMVNIMFDIQKFNLMLQNNCSEAFHVGS